MISGEVLNDIPPAGEFEEILFGEDTGTFTYVKFSDGEHAWIGVFENGVFPSQRKVFIAGEQAAVLADTILFLIDLSTKKAILVSRDHFQDLIADANQVFAVNFTTIHVLDYQRLVKVMEGYYFDMFKFVDINEDRVYCQFYQFGGGWTGLTVDRQALEIVGKYPA